MGSSHDSATLGGDTQPAAAAAGRRAPEPGTRIGRYEVLARLGAGAMGVVLEARDPKLGRRVALKVLHDELGSPRARVRLVQEAMALARLNHPNVVTIHDVGNDRGRVFIAMELVAGTTFDVWRDAGRRSPGEILERLSAAGRGLAAAHAAGLVHGDFKPSNVMIADDGRVFVLDFGLAQQVSDSVTVGEREGPLLGTPAYMSLEAFEGAPPAAAADQFAFCVTLYEALLGERPFAGNGSVEIIDALKASARISVPRSPAVPEPVRSVLRRGLARDPADRFRSMDELLQALQPGRRRRWLLASGVIAGSIVAAVTLLPSDPGRCIMASERVHEAWNEEIGARIAATFAAAHPGYGPAAWARVKTRLDDYAGRWSGAYTRACEQPIEMPGRDRAFACLGRAFTDFRATAALLEEADESVVRRAATLARGLPDVEGCTDPARHDGPPPPHDPEAQASVDRADALIAEAATLTFAGRGEQAVAMAERAIDEAEGSGYPPAIARARLARSRALSLAGEKALAAEELDRVFLVATEAGAHRLAFDAAATLAKLLAPTEPEQATLWARHAAAHLPPGDDDLQAQLLCVEAEIEGSRGHDAKALDLAEHAAERSDPTSRVHVQALQLSGGMLMRLQRHEEAIALFRRLLRITVDDVGEMHPITGAAHSNVAAALMLARREEEALPELYRSAEILEATTTGKDVKLGRTYGNLAMILRETGRAGEAVGPGLEAARIIGAALGADHPERGRALTELGLTRLALGEVDDGCARIEEGRAIINAAGGRDHDWVETAAARCRTARGDDAGARQILEALREED